MVAWCTGVLGLRGWKLLGLLAEHLSGWHLLLIVTLPLLSSLTRYFHGTINSTTVSDQSHCPLAGFWIRICYPGLRGWGHKLPGHDEEMILLQSSSWCCSLSHSIITRCSLIIVSLPLVWHPAVACQLAAVMGMYPSLAGVYSGTAWAPWQWHRCPGSPCRKCYFLVISSQTWPPPRHAH